jgi:hypothetical protein
MLVLYVQADNALQLFQLVPFQVSNILTPNSSLIPKLEKDFIEVAKKHQIIL